MEYEIEDRPQMGEDSEYEYLVTRRDAALGIFPPRPPRADYQDRAMLIPEQETGS